MVRDSEAKRRWGFVACAIAIVLVLGMWLWIRRPPPQLKPDERVFNTVDALFTALTSRDPNRLEACDRRLKSYRQEGRLSAEAGEFLDSIIQEARDGNWEPAAKRLYDFMLRQRGQEARTG